MSTEEQLPTCYRHPDRPTGLSCSECGRPICVDCMTVAPVGLRCPEHAGGRHAAKPLGKHLVVRAPQTPMAGTAALVTKTLIGINVAVYLLTVVQGGGLNSPGGRIFDELALFAPNAIVNGHVYTGVAHGAWWRLFTTMFLHANILHIAFNMLALWWIGGPVEEYLGRARFLLLYVVAGLAGSAGALFQTPGVTVGASGAIFGILGAMLILEYQATGRLAGTAMTWIVINLVFTFTFSGISWGGHIGGLIGGILGTLAFARFGRGHAAYGRLGLVGVFSLVAIGVASVALAWWKAKSYLPPGF